MVVSARCRLQVAATILFEFEGFEEGLEVPLAEALTSLTGDDLEEESGAVLQRLGEELQQVAFIVGVDNVSNP